MLVIVAKVCLFLAPANCKDLQIMALIPTELPAVCAMKAQEEVVTWLEANPGWTVAALGCKRVAVAQK